MHVQGVLEIQPPYQREVVWKENDQTRFIDSLVKQLPIPSMCFSLDYKNQQYQVIDGLQRMSTIIRFLTGAGWTLAKLDDIDPKISGQPIEKFVDKNNAELHRYFVQLENLTLPVTILRCDYTKRSHQNYIFMIFHRLNSGGSKLNNQEIRNCIYGGSFNQLLKELNANEKWMKINKMKETTGYRFIPEEIILRFFAFHDNYMSYTGRLAKFLNYYMADHRDADTNFIFKKKSIFIRTIDLVYKTIFEGKPPRKLSISVLEALLVGTALNLDFLEAQPAQSVRKMYDKLLKEDEFSEKQLREGIAGKDRVIARMNTAKKVFSGQ